MSTICSTSSAIELEEAPSPGEACVVDEKPDSRMPFSDPGRDVVDLRAVGDVAALRLRAEPGRDPLELLGSAGQEDAVPAAGGEGARGRGSDPARPSGDDGHCHAATINCSRFG